MDTNSIISSGASVSSKRTSEALSPQDNIPKKSCVQEEAIDNIDSPILDTAAQVSKSITAFLIGDEAKVLFASLISNACSSFMASINDEMASIRSDNSRLSSEVTLLKEELHAIKVRMEGDDQQKRRNNLLLTSSWPDRKDEHPGHQVVSFFSNVLNIPDVADDVISFSRVGRLPEHSGSSASSRPRPRPILITFGSMESKLRVKDAARRKKIGSLQSPVFVNDDVTDLRRKAFNTALGRKKQGQLLDVRLSGGNIRIKALDGSLRTYYKFDDFVELVAS